MTKKEFMSNLTCCKVCKTYRGMTVDFTVTENFKIKSTIHCNICGKTESMTGDPMFALASWNAENEIPTRKWIAIIQSKVSVIEVKQLNYETNNLSDIVRDIHSKYPNFNILSIKEIVTQM